MIVYAGKQFGNDFNNGDEALFQDANLPRDDFKFKIQHGIQATKQDRRTANKNINMAQAMVKGAVLTGANNLTEPFLKKEYTSSDFSFLVGYTPKGIPALTTNQITEYAKDREMWTGVGDACISVQNGHCIVNKSGTYIIEAWAEFIYPEGYNSGNSYQYIEAIELVAKDKESDEWQRAIATTERACGATGYRKASYVTYAVQGTLLNARVFHNYGANVWVGVGLNAYRLS